MKNEDFNNYIKMLGNNVDNIYNAFYLWKNLQNAKYNTIYNRYKYFWGITISSVQLNWLLGIPKLFEESKKGQEEVISIPFLLKFIPDGQDKEKIKKGIDEQKPILKNFMKWRNKILAHQDKIIADNIKDFCGNPTGKPVAPFPLFELRSTPFRRILHSSTGKPVVFCPSG